LRKIAMENGKRSKWIRGLMGIVLGALALTGASGEELTLEGVQEAAKVYSREHNGAGVELLVSVKGKSFKAAAGLADREKKLPVKPEMPFEIGSATTLFTGAAILQLIEAGKLSLDTPLVRFYSKGEITAVADYKGKGYWEKVTVGMLLRHTSGIVDYLNVYGDDARAMRILAAPGEIYNFDQIIDLVVEHGDMNFLPGTDHRYSNTGYIILGDLIRKVTGMDWRDYVQKNILDRLGMKRTWFGTRLPPEVKTQMPKGYYGDKPGVLPPSLTGSAGEIVSTLEDL
jgi:CubicO group peptidase (beta-lactamase class C family)